ncbi:hypothetical protein VPH35_067458 [Triticum aestivum]
MILGGLIDSLTGANKSARLKGTVVLMRKNVLDLTDLGATIMDGIGDFLGKGVTCQLISSTLVDHDNGGRGGGAGAVGDEPAVADDGGVQVWPHLRLGGGEARGAGRHHRQQLPQLRVPAQDRHPPRRPRPRQPLLRRQLLGLPRRQLHLQPRLLRQRR